MVCFQITEEAKMKVNKCGDTRRAWMKLSIKFEPTTGASKTIIHNKFAEYELYNIARHPEYCITEQKIYREDLEKLNIHIYNMEMITHILSNLLKAYKRTSWKIYKLNWMTEMIL